MISAWCAAAAQLVAASTAYGVVLLLAYRQLLHDLQVKLNVLAGLPMRWPATLQLLFCCAPACG